METAQDLLLQIGANQENQFPIDLTDARTAVLGIEELIIDPCDKVEIAITLVDETINTANTERAKYGVYQNALKHINPQCRKL
ncbi:hypothetical protein [Oceanobacillus halotolerans]|uniref:hypothetical protein n=1 Tax=Oceanobacillus halotolerans TaxID=2663380 RepID=UPI0013DAC1F0|nr:hypothetical protein [Oceanobacillus halotolerans]